MPAVFGQATGATLRFEEKTGLVTVDVRRDGDRVTGARMFAPLTNNWENPATGSATAALGAYLTSLEGNAETQLEIEHGVEMGRTSLITVTAQKAAGQIGSVTIEGSCVPVMRGQIEL